MAQRADDRATQCDSGQARKLRDLAQELRQRAADIELGPDVGDVYESAHDELIRKLLTAA